MIGNSKDMYNDGGGEMLYWDGSDCGVGFRGYGSYLLFFFFQAEDGIRDSDM